MYYICIIYVLYMCYMCVIYVLYVCCITFCIHVSCLVLVEQTGTAERQVMPSG